MGKIRIITDSTAYLPEKMAKDLGITVVPLAINFRGETYPEGSRYSNAEFFRMVSESPVLPTTSQPPAGSFVEAFRQLFAEGAEDIICIFISTELSGTYYSAQTAVEILDTDRVHLFDSRFTVNSQRYMVLTAVEMAEQGKSVPDILSALEQIKERMSLYFVVETLENLRKGGRIGGAATLIGTLLQVKPILYLRDGKIEVFDKVRTKSKAWARVCQELDKSIAGGRPHRIGVLHVHAPADAERLADDLRLRYPGQQIDVDAAGQVIGTHVGQGTVGLGFYPTQG